MAKVTVCNGCGQPKKPDEVKRVTVIEATLPGDSQQRIRAGELRTDRTTEGELCGPCVAAMHEFVGESSDDDVRDDAHVVVTSGAATV